MNTKSRAGGPRPAWIVWPRWHAGICGAPLLALGLLLPATALRAQAVNPSQEPAQNVPAEPEPTVQLATPGGAAQTGAPLTLTLQDAIERARKNDAQYLSAVTDARLAHEDKVQARAALLPAVSTTTQELLTTGDSVLPTSRFVTNDGVHVYRAWGVLHQELGANLFTLNGYRHASAAEMAAAARQEIALRGLTVTVTQAYYGLVAAQRKYATAQESLRQAQEFVKITSDRESGGEAAHSDVIKAQIQLNQQQAAYQDAQLAMENARLGLAVLLFPELNENFTVVEDPDQGPALPSWDEARARAMRNNPDLRVALETLQQANLDVSAARNSFLPTLSLDEDYGIESNYFALRSRVAAEPAAGVQNNLGNFITANLQIPVWDWGALRSKLHQAEWRRQQARVNLSAAQRNLVGGLTSAFNSASVSRAQVDLLRRSAALASESARLTTLRYQAGDATVLEVVDAQNTLAQARNAYADGETRYRVALANLQTFTGNL